MGTVRGHAFPDDLYYHPGHMVWVRREADGRATLGLSALALATGGELIVFAARPIGSLIERDRAVANVETAKTVSSVRTPIAGRLIEANGEIEADGSRINADPYAAWLVRIEPEDWARDIVSLVTGAEAMAAIEREMALYRVGE